MKQTSKERARKPARVPIKVSPQISAKLAKRFAPVKMVSPAQMTSVKFRLEPKVLVKIHDQMIRARLLEERLIRMYKQSDGYFWIGGPGEEAFNIP
ncbi:MAG: hypothetical protein AABZ55_14350, partial [Bdellovibrionota bacterium]